MSRWFSVPLTITINVKVPDNEGVKEALSIAETLFWKRLCATTWGIGNPWTASVAAKPSFGEPQEGISDGDDDDITDLDDDEVEEDEYGDD